MGLISGLKGLFSGSGAGPQAAAEEYAFKDYTLVSEPLAEGSSFRVNGVVRKGDKEHRFIRADLAHSADACHELTRRKMEQALEQMGDSIFR